MRFMLCGLLTALGFFWLPAQGTCAFYELDVPAHYRPILDHLAAMRDGARTAITWRDAEGLVVFPSFHTVWGLLLVLAFWPDRRLRWPIVALNAAMIVSTIPIGMHYLADVLGGFGVTGLVLAGESAWAGASRRAAARRVGPRREQEAEAPRRWFQPTY